MVNQSELLEEVAGRLYSNLHSSENENIISSLLTASLNESTEFRNGFCREATGHDRDFSSFYAMANYTLPDMLRARKEPSKPRYRQPDILVWDRLEDVEWRLLEDKEAEVSEERKKEAARKIHAIFVEIKHTDLGRKHKYERFAERLSRLDQKGNNLKFVVISSHSRQGLKRLNEAWQDLRKCLEAKRHKHMTIHDVYEAARSIDGRTLRQCYVLRALKNYLALHDNAYEDAEQKGVFEKRWASRVAYWKDIADRLSEAARDYADLSFKSEILDEIKWVAARAGISGGSWGKYIDDKTNWEAKLGELDIVRFVRRGTSYQPKFQKYDRKLPKEIRYRNLQVHIDGSLFQFKLDFEHRNEWTMAEAVVDSISRISRRLTG